MEAALADTWRMAGLGTVRQVDSLGSCFQLPGQEMMETRDQLECNEKASRYEDALEVGEGMVNSR